MAITLFESGKKTEKPRPSVVTGTVINNCDLLTQAKVLVRIPSLDQEVWARISSPGAGSGAGLFYTPRADDEVLVGLTDGGEDAYIIGGLWNTQDSPPVSNNLDAMTKRKIKTGIGTGVAHEVEFDDGPNQSITITTSTQQQITLDPKKIELSTTQGTVKITLDLTNQAVKIDAPASVEITSKGTLKLVGSQIQIGDSAQTLQTTIQGAKVFIN